MFVTIVPCFLQLTFFSIHYLPKGLIGSEMVRCFDCMWCGRLYLHTHGAAVGQMGTFDNGLEEVDIAVTAYANEIFVPSSQY